MLREFQHLSRTPAISETHTHVYVVRSDGMNKQKDVPRRAVQAIADAEGNLIWDVQYDAEKNHTTALCRAAGDIPHRIKVVV
jgi:hypothetical protein